MQVNGDGYEKLNAAIERASYTTTLYVPETKQELKQVYQQEYGKSWQKHLSEDVARMKYGDNMSEKDFQKKVHNESRNFNPDRINTKVTGKKASQFVSLGRRHATEVKEPKDISGKRAKVTWKGALRTYDEKRMRPGTTYNVTLNASEARELRHGSFDPIFVAEGFPSGIVEEIDVDSVSVQFL